MRVERVEAVPYALPFRAPYASARGTIERREMVLLRLRTEAGAEGLGEAVPLTLRGGHGLAEIARELEEAGTRLLGLDLGAGDEGPLATAVATFLELARPRPLAPPAAAALECALFDLAAKEAGEPLHETLKASGSAAVECNATLTTGDPTAVAEQARSWAAEGFRTFKLKVGAGGEAETVAGVRTALGPEARIRVDANEAWQVDEAVAQLDELAAYDVELAEQPVAGLRGLARVADRVEVPLAADESVTSEADAHRAVQRRACAYATVKLSKVGGIGAARAIAAVIPTYLSSALDGPVGIAAAAHAAQVLRDAGDPGLAHGLATQRLFAATIARRECELRGGMLHLPDGPGLGVELDEDALAAHRL